MAPSRGFRGTPEERFWRKVRRAGDAECWLWTAGTYSTGYGVLSVDGRHTPAHRFSWQLQNGPIPGELCVLHKCDVRACVNPAHLLLGTKKDNSQDMLSKGRGYKCQLKGEAHGASKLTADDVRAIRRGLASGANPFELAKRFSIHRATVKQIETNKTWVGVV